MLSNSSEQQTMPHRVLRNSVSNYFGQFLARGLWFFLTPLLLHHLGADDYGLWVLIGSVVAYGSLLNLGMGGAVIKYVSEYHARGEMERARSLMATVLRMYTLLGGVVIAVTGLLAFILPHLFNLPAEQQSTARWLVLLMGVGVGISIPCSIPGAVLRGLQRYDIVSLISVIGALLSAAGMVAVLLLGGGVIGVAVVGIAVTLMVLLPQVWFVRRAAPEFRLQWRGAQRTFIRPVLGFSSSLLAIDMAGRLQSKTDDIVIGAFLPVKFIAPYAIARGAGELVLVLTHQFVRVLLPLASELHAKDNRDRLRALYIIGTRLTLAIAFVVGCPLIIYRETILTLWVGADYAAYGYVVVIIAVACLIETSQWPAGLILQGIGMHRWMAAMAMCSGIANLALAVALVRPYGLAGIAAARLIPTAVVSLVIFLPYSMSVIGVSKSQLANQAFLPALLPAIPAALVLYILQRAIEPFSWLTIVVASSIGVFVYIIGYLNLAASEVERQTCRSFAVGAARYVEARLTHS